MRKHIAFAVIVFPVLVGHIGSTAITVAFPTIVDHFDTSLVMAGWVLNVYILVTIGSIPIIARLSDTVGRRSIFMLCLALYTIGSLLCSIAPSIGWLIFFRIIQAIGGGGFVSAATGIISDEFPTNRQRLIGLTVSTATFGSIAGPNVGGFLVTYLGWQSVFWLNVPVGIVALVLAKFFIKADVRGSPRGQVDFLGVGLLFGCVSSVVISVTLLDKGYQIPYFMIGLLVLLGVAFLGMFIFRSKNTKNPVFTMQMFFDRPFMAANVYNFAYGACGENGIVSLLPLYAVSVYGMSVLESGLAVTPRSVGVFVISVIASLTIMKWGYRRPIIIGSLITAVGLVLLAVEPGGATLSGWGVSPMMLVMVLGLIVGVGGGLVNPAANNACIDLMPEKAASITGLRQIFRRMGQTVGIAVSTVVLEYGSSIAWGFTVLMICFAAMLLLSIVAVFWMPECPKPQTGR